MCWKLSTDDRRLRAVCEDTTRPSQGYFSTKVLLHLGCFRSYAQSRFQADM